jgi:hypothetical protein
MGQNNGSAKKYERRNDSGVPQEHDKRGGWVLGQLAEAVQCEHQVVKAVDGRVAPLQNIREEGALSGQGRRKRGWKVRTQPTIDHGGNRDGV